MVSMKDWEKSAADKKLDKKLGYKEGSKQDNAADKAAVTIINMGGIGPYRPTAEEHDTPDPQKWNSSRDRVVPRGGFAGDRNPSTFRQSRNGKLRCSGHAGAHQIGKRK